MFELATFWTGGRPAALRSRGHLEEIAIEGNANAKKALFARSVCSRF